MWLNIIRQRKYDKQNVTAQIMIKIWSQKQNVIKMWLHKLWLECDCTNKMLLKCHHRKIERNVIWLHKQIVIKMWLHRQAKCDYKWNVSAQIVIKQNVNK